MDNIIIYEVDQTDDFNKNARRLTKKKGFRSLPGQILDLEEQLAKGEFPGVLIRSVEGSKPYEVYKLRLPNPDANVGKSGGYRVYYLVVVERKVVMLLTIYYKKEDETVSDAYIDGLIDGVFIDSVPYEDYEDCN